MQATRRPSVPFALPASVSVSDFVSPSPQVRFEFRNDNKIIMFTSIVYTSHGCAYHALADGFEFLGPPLFISPLNPAVGFREQTHRRCMHEAGGA